MTFLPRILFVSHALGGGVEGHVSDLKMLLADVALIEVLRPVSPTVVQLQLPDNHLLTWRSDNWGKLLMGLQSRGYDRIHFHHVDGFVSSILYLAEGLKIPYDVTLHDYFPYCPQYQLSSTDNNGYCGEPDAKGCQTCVNAKPHSWGWTIAQWRTSMGQFLNKAERVIAPTNHVVTQVRKHFPELAICMQNHPPRGEWLVAPKAKIKVVIIGALSRIKGLNKLLDCARLAQQENNPLAFVLLGYPEFPIDPQLPIQIRGQYEDKDLPALLALERPDVVWFPGVFPETHAYTLDVAIDGGFPIVASARGAFLERLSNRPNCELLDADAAESECNSAFASIAISHVSSQPLPLNVNRRDGQALRDTYRKFITEPLTVAPLRGLQQPNFDLLELDFIPPASVNLPLTVLFEHGVLCGMSQPRHVLFQRLTDIERDYAVLARYSEKANKPWFVLLEETENIALDADHLRRKAVELRAEADRVRASLQEHILQLEQGLHAHADALTQKEQEVQSIRANLNEITHHLAQSDQLYLARGKDLCELEANLARAVGQLRKFETSTSWRITAPWRFGGAILKTSKQRLNKVIQSVQYGYQKLPLALQILRNHGLVALARRIQMKVKGERYQPPAAPTLVIAEIQSLELHTCAEHAEPKVSLVIPVYGQHVHTFNCLKSLAEHTDLSMVEIIVIDDASPVSVSAAMPNVKGIRLLRNEENLGFIGSCNRGGGASRGEYIVLLNNDIQVTAGWLDALLDVFGLRSDAGLVGARLVYPDGRLQEAGGIVWRDGSAWNWGRDGDPEHPDYRYLRAVDYCSGACLAMRREDWLTWNGFDTTFTPAYYEDTDLAFRVRAAGKQVYYQPDAKIIHFEGVSSGTDLSQGVKKHQVINQTTFLKRWQKTLQAHRINGQEAHREVDRGAKKHFLIVEACMITPDQDSGSVRMLAILELLIELGCKVSFVADNLELRQPYARRLQQIGVEIWHYPYIRSVSQLLDERGDQFDVIMFCRHYIASPYIKRVREWAPHARIVFDTVDLHYLREQRQAELESSASVLAMAERTRNQELAVIDGADITLVVSPIEQALLVDDAPGALVKILSNIHEPRIATTGYAEREGLLFIGGFRHPPNVDAVSWFVAEVWPLVRSQLPTITLTLVGSHMPDAIKALDGNGIRALGFVEDVEPLLDHARVSLAPLRYGAGVKGKINQAMACGLPVVATTVAAEGMGLVYEEELLVADTPQGMADAIIRLNGDEKLWRKISEGGYDNVRRHFSRRAARTALESILA